MLSSKMKKIVVAGVAVLALSALSVTAFAASAYNSPAEAVAALTGKTVESVADQRKETGDTYCTIASEAGVLDEYKAAVLEMKKDALNERVASGKLTQERADEIAAAIESKMADCDGIGSETRGGMMGFGACNGLGTGDGTGNGNCEGTDGTCTGNGNGGRNGMRSQQQSNTCVTND